MKRLWLVVLTLPLLMGQSECEPNNAGTPQLSVSLSSVSLTDSSTSDTVTVSNKGDGTLSWTASSSDRAVRVSPSSFSGNSKEVTIVSDDFSESFDAEVTFTNDADAGDTAVVAVSVTGSVVRLDVVFILDTTGSMAAEIVAVQSSVDDSLDLIAEEAPDYRVAAVEYRDFPIAPHGQLQDFPFKTIAPFTSNLATVSAAVNALSADGGSDAPGSLYTAIMHALESAEVGGWRSAEVNKAIIFVTDGPPHDPEVSGEWQGFEASDVVSAAGEGGIAIDSRNGLAHYDISRGVAEGSIRIYPILIGNDPTAAQRYEVLAQGTDGELIPASSVDNIAGALEQAILSATNPTSK